ncbi:MAG TPA: MBL fold metallo-hydrolase, partial [Kineosporiaceae bacterium]|nr:MBL fold metallo-hydrolase [Kineosporiaceae bacterium]
QAIGGRRVLAIVSTHGHNDHISAAGELADATGAPVLLHPADRMLWDAVHPGRTPEHLADGDRIEVAGTVLQVLHTPGHSPGGICLRVADLDAVLSGDTLFRGGPGATGRSFSSFPAILDSIRERLLTLPARTQVLTGHGDATTIGAEAAGYDVWVARGH